jgi:hypothetical protein
MRICGRKNTQMKITARGNNEFIIIGFEDYLIKGTDFQIPGNFGCLSH